MTQGEPTGESPVTDFFISYRNVEPDRHWAAWLAWILEEEGFRVIIYEWDFVPGTRFISEMHKALTDADRTIIVLSPRYLESKYTEAEWTAAYQAMLEGRKKPLVICRIEDFEIEGLLASMTTVDLFDVEDEIARERVLSAVKVKRQKVKSDFPVIKSKRTGESVIFPGTLPGIWNVPPRNPHFTGRSEYLEKIEKHLCRIDDTGTPPPVAIHGLGGMGKTEIAKEYAYRCRDRYDVVWWIRSEKSAMVASDYALLGNHLGLITEAGEDTGINERVRGWLERSEKPWLLVFDNAEFERDIRDFIPRGGLGHIILTSRNRDWPNAVGIQAGNWSENEAVDYLLKRTGQDDRKSATELTSELGNYPLALSQAAAYIIQRDKSLAEYLDLFSRHKFELLERGRPAGDYSHTVTTTWDMAFSVIGEMSPVSARFLNICSLLGADDICLDMFRQESDDLPPDLAACVIDELAFDDMLQPLLQYSLLVKRDDSLSMHRLVQAVTRDRLSTTERTELVKIAIRMLADCFPESGEDPATWDKCARLAHHVMSVTDLDECEKYPDERICSLLRQLAAYLVEQSDFSAAQRIVDKAIRLNGDFYNDAHPNYAECLYHSGKLLQRMRKHNDARKQLEMALRIDTEAYGKNHPTVARDLDELGNAMSSIGDLEKACELYERAYEINVREFGESSPKVADNIHNLGLLYRKMGNLGKARDHFERALDINMSAFGAKNPVVAVNMHSLGCVYRDLGEFWPARRYFEQSLKAGEEHFGPDHPINAIRAGNLGLVMKDLGNYESARELFERAINIELTAFGHDRPNLTYYLNNLGSLLYKTGDLEGAREKFELALEIHKALYGSDHPSLASKLNNLGFLLKEMGDYDEALTLIHHALRIEKDTYGEHHPKVAVKLANLAGVLHEMGDLRGARIAAERALEIGEDTLPKNHDRLAVYHRRLALVFEALRDNDEALRHMRKAYAIRVESLGEDHEDTLEIKAQIDRMSG